MRGHCFHLENFVRISAFIRLIFFILQQFENALLIIGDILEALVMSQKHQLQLSVKVSPELIQLVKRFHQRWNELKQKVEGRHSAIDRAMVKYDPVNLGVAGRSHDSHMTMECIYLLLFLSFVQSSPMVGREAQLKMALHITSS